MTKDEALKMAIKAFMQLNERSPRKEDGSGYFDKEIQACKEALERPQPKESQYLYVSQGGDGTPQLRFIEHQDFLFKIKLEVDDD